MKRYTSLIILVIILLQFTLCQAENVIKGDNILDNNESQTLASNIYEEDYLQACTLISKNYIYLERKLDKTREEFLEECKTYAKTVDWGKGKTQFIEEIRKLGSKFPDGHFSWYLDENSRINNSKYLGFTATIGADNKVYVAKVYPYFTDKLSVGDEILKWNGVAIEKEIERIGKINPQSTKYATNGLAARRLSIEWSFRPLRRELKPVTITFRNKEGIEWEITLNWNKCAGTTDWEDIILNENNQGNVILLTRSLIPSLEEIPIDVRYEHPSLLYYTRNIYSKKYVILHPRDFYHWEMSDLDNTFKEILKEKPDIIVVDLKDSAGGAFDRVLYLSYALNVQKEFEFFYDKINSQTGLRLTGVDNFNFITEEINFANIWKGKVVFRINPLTKSGGDFFIRWMQLAGRGLIIGQPSAGAGGGTSDYILNNTKTEVDIPMRERIIVGDNKSIEGNSIIPDYLYDGKLIDFLKGYK